MSETSKLSLVSFVFAWLILLLFLGQFGCKRSSTVDTRPNTNNVSGNFPSALNVDRQKYIWDIEHTAFELEQKFGKALLSALRQRNVDQVTSFFRSELTVETLDPKRTKLIDQGFIKEWTTDGTQPIESRNAEEFARYLINFFQDFEAIQSAKFRVLSLDAQDRKVSADRWEMTVLLAAQGKKSDGSQVEFESHHELSCTFANDAAIEKGQIVDAWKVLDSRQRSSPSPLFREVTNQVGLHKVDIQDNWSTPTENVRQYHTQVAVEDFDRDGYLDIATASHNGRWRLLRSAKGERFSEITSSLGLPMWTDEEPRSRASRQEIYLAAWIDFDNDAFPDLILGDRVFHNMEGKRFEDVTERSQLTFAYNPRGCVVADFDCDGRLDLYVLYQNRRDPEPRASPAGWVMDSESGAENQLWRNLGQGRFENVTEKAGAGGGRRQTFAAAWLHANQDLLPDLYMVNDFGMNVMLMNQGNGLFTDVSDELGVGSYATSMGVATGDLTGDGDPEIYVANMFSKMGRRIIAHVGAEDYPPGVYDQIKGSCAGNTLFTRGGSQQKFEEKSELFGVNQVGWAYAPVLADFDADGFLDIYATCGFLSFQRKKPDG